MEAGVFIEFGVEGYAELLPWRAATMRPSDLCQGLGVAVDLDDAGRADKRQRHFTVDARLPAPWCENAELPAVGIALDKYIHGCQTRRALIVMGGKVVS